MHLCTVPLLASTGDLVAYYDSAEQIRLRLGVVDDKGRIVTVQQRGMDEGATRLFHESEDENQGERRLSDIRLIHVFASAQWTQRLVEDRVSNPHGEHAEDVWIVSINELHELAAKNNDQAFDN
jgi:hypothetical protein